MSVSNRESASETKWEKERAEIVDRCRADVSALVAEAKAAGVPAEETVIVIADRRDDRGRAFLLAAAEIGVDSSDETVAVLGLPRELARKFMMSVDATVGRALATALDPTEPELLVLSYDYVGRGSALR